MDPTTSAMLCTIQKALGAFCALLQIGRPAGLLEVATLLNCDPKTVRKQLDGLVRQQGTRKRRIRKPRNVSPKTWPPSGKLG